MRKTTQQVSVLVVDDSEDGRDMYSEYLTFKGFSKSSPLAIEERTPMIHTSDAGLPASAVAAKAGAA